MEIDATDGTVVLLEAINDCSDAVVPPESRRKIKTQSIDMRGEMNSQDGDVGVKEMR